MDKNIFKEKLAEFFLMRVTIVNNLPPRTNEVDLIASLSIFGDIKGFGMCKNTAFVDFEHSEDAKKAIRGPVIVNGWKANVFKGDSITKVFRSPTNVSFEKKQKAYQDYYKVSNCIKYRFYSKSDIGNQKLYEQLVSEFGSNLVCFSRSTIWLSSPPLQYSAKFKLSLLVERHCYYCDYPNDFDYFTCVSCNTDREICKICKFENIPLTRYCSGCGFDKKNGGRAS